MGTDEVFTAGDRVRNNITGWTGTVVKAYEVSTLSGGGIELIIAKDNGNVVFIRPEFVSRIEREMRAIRSTAWATDYAGAAYRLKIVDRCYKCNVAEAHYLQYKEEDYARCLVCNAPDRDLDVPSQENASAQEETIDAATEAIGRGAASVIALEIENRRISSPIPPAVFSHKDSQE